MQYENRTDAGRRLAGRVVEAALEDPLVLALPRGGMPVGFEVAAALRAPLDVLVARKLGAPGQPELGIGAIAEGLDEPVLNDIARRLGVDDERMEQLIRRERAELDRRVRHYRGERPLPDPAGRDVVLVDDGLATGVTAEAALRALHGRRPRRLMLAVPVCAPDTAARLGKIADQVVCDHCPPDFRAVGMWYDDFGQTTDEEVLNLLRSAGRSPNGDRPAPTVAERLVRIDQPDEVAVHGDLSVPEGAAGVVVFAHGSGSGRHSQRNQQVAAHLQGCGLATLLMDLLTDDEEESDRHTAHLRFDIDLLAGRLLGAVGWLGGPSEVSNLPVGLFGASTGGAAAVVAAAREPGQVAAVVSRGGRPDLARDALGEVRAPTLLIVGGDDDVVLDLNRRASDQITAEKRLDVIPGATHLFEEPGALEEVARLAGEWFVRHLTSPAPAESKEVRR